MIRFHKILTSVLCSLLSLNVCAELGMPAVFSDGAVLQCQRKIPVWGWGNPGSTVAVKFSGQTEKTKVKADGTWLVTLNPIEPSYDRRTMTVTSGSDTLEYQDIVLGEVWLCAGQSNMESTLNAMSRRTRDEGYESVVAFMQKEKGTAKDKFLRHLKVSNKAIFSIPQRDFEGKWTACSSQNNGEFSAVAYFFGKELRKRLDRPVGLLNTSWGSQRIDPFIPPSAWKADPGSCDGYARIVPQFKKNKASYDPEAAQKTYKVAMKVWQASGKRTREPRKPQPPSLDTPSYPGTIFNGMIHPLAPYAMRGVIWYQGESHNQNRAHHYGKKLEMLVSGIRNEWGKEDLPFYFCQLANLREPQEQPFEGKNNWLMVSDQIRLAADRIPNTGMVVLNDVGQVGDIHPRNKYDVGLRLSKWALNKDYGFKNIIPAGPLYKSSKVNGASMIVTFDHAGSELMTSEKQLMTPAEPNNKPLGGFQICGKDRVWKWAEAKIIGNNQVRVFEISIKNPIGVRYAWQSNPVRSNLYNKEGLPAGLFSSLSPATQ
ncbi:MAG: sialate O-acetylesterase [Akkermansiaceae bacterium]